MRKLAALVIGILVLLSTVSAQSDYELRQCERLDSADPCYRNLAIAHSDATICRLIDAVSTRNSCYSKIVDNTKDKSLCLNIRKERGSFEDKYECYRDFIEGIDDRDFCAIHLKGDEEAQEKCYTHIATRSGDVTLCGVLALEDSQMECLSNIISGSTDESLCQLFRTEIDLKRCKAQAGNSCDTREKIDTAVFECESEILVDKRRAICRSHPGRKEFNLDENEEQDIDFRGYDDPVYLKYKSASVISGVGVFDMTIDGRTRELTLQPGMTGEYRFANIYMIDVVGRGTDEQPEAPRMALCGYPDPVPKVSSPPPEEEPEPVEEELEPEPVVEGPEIDKPVEEQEVAPKKKVVTGTRPGFFHWLGSIFGGVGGFLKNILI